MFGTARRGSWGSEFKFGGSSALLGLRFRFPERLDEYIELMVAEIALGLSDRERSEFLYILSVGASNAKRKAPNAE